MLDLRRREFIGLLGGAAAWPIAARAQQPDRMRRLGVLVGYAESDVETQSRMGAFRQKLQELGWTEGRNIHIEYRVTGADPDRIRGEVEGLVSRAPEAILVRRAKSC
jgi:putative tryptophan/tyrosine transport system substrate-binding protein